MADPKVFAEEALEKWEMTLLDNPMDSRDRNLLVLCIVESILRYTKAEEKERNNV